MYGASEHWQVLPVDALVDVSAKSLIDIFKSLRHLARKLVLGFCPKGKYMGLLLAWIEAIPWQYTLMEMAGSGSGADGASAWKIFIRVRPRCKGHPVWKTGQASAPFAPRSRLPYF